MYRNEAIRKLIELDIPDRLSIGDSDGVYYDLQTLILSDPAESGSFLIDVLLEYRELTKIQFNGYFRLWRSILSRLRELKMLDESAQLLKRIEALTFGNSFNTSIRLEVAGLCAKFSEGERDSYIIELLMNGTTHEKWEAFQLVMTQPVHCPPNFINMLKEDSYLASLVPLLD